MFDKLKDFLLNKALGRVIVRLVASAATGLASGQLGFSLELSPEQQVQLVGAAISGINGLISWLKPRLPKIVPASLPPIPVPGELMKPFDYKP